MNDQSPRRFAPPPATSDALSEVLQDFRLSGVDYSRCDLRHPWSIALPAQALVRLHFVSRGQCWIHTDAQGWQALNEGDLVLLPQGAAHRLASAPDVAADAACRSRIVELGNNVREVVQDGAGAATVLFCGSMALGASALDPLVALMPPVIKGFDVVGSDPIIGPLVAALTAEIARPQMGSATILSRIADLLAAQLIRCSVNCAGASTNGWLAAIRDPHIGRVLAAMHRDPGHRWTLASLARLAGQSRSVFAERFNGLVGEGAARYLGRLRMQLGRELLEQHGISTAEAAARLGYASEASFARAFKRITRLSPGSARRGTAGRTDMDPGLWNTDHPGSPA
jgi:AraC-like DNA-binding protein